MNHELSEPGPCQSPGDFFSVVRNYRLAAGRSREKVTEHPQRVSGRGLRQSTSHSSQVLRTSSNALPGPGGVLTRPSNRAYCLLSDRRAGVEV